MDDDSEEALLQRALAMSMDTDAAASEGGASATAGGSTASAAKEESGPNLAAMTEEEQIALAMQMSMQDGKTASFISPQIQH